MVLHHIAQLTHPVVVGPTPLDPHLFCNGDLNMINATLIPLGIDKAIGKSQYKDVLDCFFAEVVVDAVGLVFS